MREIEVQVRRKRTGDQGTFSDFLLPEFGWESRLLELPWRDNKPRISCVPSGVFYAELAPHGHLWSPREDGKLYRFLDIPGRQLVEIHAATWAGDVSKGWHSDLEGCMAPGLKEGVLAPPDTGKEQECILNSRAALREFMNLTDTARLRVTIMWYEGAAP